MKLDIYQVDAFASEVFSGNPAAVCPLDAWLEDEVMQSIAAENNLAETAFFVETKTGYHLRWFTPKAEVKLCGHATLATAFVINEILGKAKAPIKFQTLSGELVVSSVLGLYTMNFPATPPLPCATPEALIAALGARPMACYKGEDYFAVFENESEIQGLNPDFSKLKELELRGLTVCAKGNKFDFVTRFFAPKYGIDEDHVTGSAFTSLIPYWAIELKKTKLLAKQVSERGGVVGCELIGERVKISGRAVEYLRGQITI